MVISNGITISTLKVRSSPRVTGGGGEGEERIQFGKVAPSRVSRKFLGVEVRLLPIFSYAYHQFANLVIATLAYVLRCRMRYIK